MRGRTVEVGIAKESGADAFGHPLFELEWETVDDVLIDPRPMDTESSESSEHDPLFESSITLHFPKGYGKSLKNARVRALGHEYEVRGDPIPYPEELTPTRWNLPVRARRADGN